MIKGKTIKWISGLSLFVGKTKLDAAVAEVKETGKFTASRNSFTNYSRNTKASGWKSAVGVIYGRDGVKAIETITTAGHIEMTKARLSKLG